jgi:hypothetical protein
MRKDHYGHPGLADDHSLERCLGDVWNIPAANKWALASLARSCAGDSMHTVASGDAGLTEGWVVFIYYLWPAGICSNRCCYCYKLVY